MPDEQDEQDDPPWECPNDWDDKSDADDPIANAATICCVFGERHSGHLGLSPFSFSARLALTSNIVLHAPH